MLPLRDLKKLAKLCGMLGSGHAVERANAAAAADKLVRERGLTWPILLGTEQLPADNVTDSDCVNFCRAHRRSLNDWEREFVDGIAGYISRGWPLSVKQRNRLAKLYQKAKHGGPA
jgi:hypothetical protein